MRGRTLEPTAKLARVYRLLIVTTLIALGASAAATWLWHSRGVGVPVPTLAELAQDDPAIRNAAIQELVARASGDWDTFPDPAVGRVLQPNLSKGRELDGASVSTNAIGLRERPFALPKPEGTVRVAFLGDSFVMGHAIAAQDRVGVFLERFLSERAAAGHGPIECLHLGINTWNIAAETAFLRRQLGLLRPDLVIHLVVRNDLEDNAGARGFGGVANVNPLHPERGEGLFQTRIPTAAFGRRQNNWLLHGLDFESRSRFEQAAADIARLARDVEAQGGRYLLLDYYTGLLPASRHFLAKPLQPEQVAYLPTALQQDEKLRVSKDDAHWNRAGHELVAKLLYSLVEGRKLLPRLTLAPWPEADVLAADWLRRGADEAAAEPEFDRLPGRRSVGPTIDFDALDDDSAAQVHGGIHGGGFVAPYASVILRGQGRRTLRVAGTCLDRPEIDGAQVDVFVEESKVGEIALRSGAPIDATFQVSEAVAARPFVSARFQASDYAYGGPELRLHLVFRIRRIALE